MNHSTTVSGFVARRVPDDAGKRPPRAALATLWGLALPGAVLAGVEAAVALGWLPARLMPPPSEIVSTLRELAQAGLAGHIGVSAARVFAGFAAGALAGTLTGALVGLSPRAEAVLDPSFQALRAIPGLAWVPLLLLWMGIDEGPKVTMIAIGAFFPVYLGLVAGIKDVDRKLVELGVMSGLGRAQLVRRIFLPAALPSLFTGLRTSLSLAWMFLVAAELIAATRGLGYLLTDGREVSRPDIVLAAIIVLALLGKASDTALKAVEARSLAWRDTFDSARA